MRGRRAISRGADAHGRTQRQKTHGGSSGDRERTNKRLHVCLDICVCIRGSDVTLNNLSKGESETPRIQYPRARGRAPPPGGARWPWRWHPRARPRGGGGDRASPSAAPASRHGPGAARAVARSHPTTAGGAAPRPCPKRSIRCWIRCLGPRTSLLGCAESLGSWPLARASHRTANRRIQYTKSQVFGTLSTRPLPPSRTHCSRRRSPCRSRCPPTREEGAVVLSQSGYIIQRGCGYACGVL